MINNNKNMLPWFVTGFSDAEGSFMVKLSKSNNLLGLKVQLDFSIGIHKSDLQILTEIKSFFNVGQISVRGNVAMYSVKSLREILEVIIPHFDKYPLFTKKNADFLLFKSAAFIMKSKNHLNSKGLQKILNIRASLNRGLTSILWDLFPNTVPLERFHINNYELNGDWLAGFVSGDGGFSISTSLNNTKGKISFYITQNKRDKDLLESISIYLGCGTVVSSNKDTFNLQVRKFSDNYNIIIPFFNKYTVKGIKYLNYLDWVAAASLIYNNGDIKEIIKIIELKKQRKDSLFS